MGNTASVAHTHSPPARRYAIPAAPITLRHELRRRHSIADDAIDTVRVITVRDVQRPSSTTINVQVAPIVVKAERSGGANGWTRRQLEGAGGGWFAAAPRHSPAAAGALDFNDIRIGGGHARGTFLGSIAPSRIRRLLSHRFLRKQHPNTPDSSAHHHYACSPNEETGIHGPDDVGGGHAGWRRRPRHSFAHRNFPYLANGPPSATSSACDLGGHGYMLARWLQEHREAQELLMHPPPPPASFLGQMDQQSEHPLQVPSSRIAVPQQQIRARRSEDATLCASSKSTISEHEEEEDEDVGFTRRLLYPRPVPT